MVDDPYRTESHFAPRVGDALGAAAKTVPCAARVGDDGVAEKACQHLGDGALPWPHRCRHRRPADADRQPQEQAARPGRSRSPRVREEKQPDGRERRSDRRGELEGRSDRCREKRANLERAKVPARARRPRGRTEEREGRDLGCGVECADLAGAFERGGRGCCGHREPLHDPRRQDGASERRKPLARRGRLRAGGAERDPPPAADVTEALAQVRPLVAEDERRRAERHRRGYEPESARAPRGDRDSEADADEAHVDGVRDDPVGAAIDVPRRRKGVHGKPPSVAPEGPPAPDDEDRSPAGHRGADGRRVPCRCAHDALGRARPHDEQHREQEDEERAVEDLPRRLSSTAHAGSPARAGHRTTS